MGKRAENKVHIGLWVDRKVQIRLDELSKIFGLNNRSEVILRLLSYGVDELQKTSAREQLPRT